MDMAGIHGHEASHYQAQINTILKLQSKYPNRILPFLCLNPRDPNMRSYFDTLMCDGATAGFWGVKIYPSLGYLPSDPKLMPIFEICEAKQIPITAHCSGASVHTSDIRMNHIRGLRLHNGRFEEVHETKWFWGASAYAEYFNHPKCWEPVLHTFSKLRLNLAHFGAMRTGWYTRIVSMLERYENLYTDVSYTLSNARNHNTISQIIEGIQVVRERVLYGTDFYMVVQEGSFNEIKTLFHINMGDVIIKQMQANNRKFLFGV
jgi:predicted TIM-barrel fold metal-dependent hydrolase